MARYRNGLVDFATVAAAVCAVTLTINILWQGRPTPDARESTMVDEWEVYAAEGHRIGPAHAAVTIVEWGDYQCPFCRSLAPILQSLLEAYPDDVSVVYRHWPLTRHDAARPAAEAALCADEQGRFVAFHDALYRENGWMSNPGEGLLVVAEDVGIPDLDRFERCMEKGPESSDVIDRDIAAVKALGGTGTPTVMINGLLLGSAPDSTGWHALVGERLGTQ